MPYRSLGKTGLQVPLMGLGTWKMGMPETGDGARINETASMAILDAAHARGVCFWDTANRYNNASGNSERIIGKWLKQHASYRRDIILCTKMGGAMDGITPNHSGLSRKNILESVYACLERLEVDAIDLLYFHLPDPKTSADESLAAVEDLISQRLVHYFGVSNYTVEQLEACTRANISIRTQIAALQNQFDLLLGEPQTHSGAYQFCIDNTISYVPWSPLARGLLSGKYKPGVDASPGDRLYDENALGGLAKENVSKRLNAFISIANEIGVPLNQLVIAYMTQMEMMGPLIIASSSVNQLNSNADGALLSLSSETTEKIDLLLSK